MSILGIATSTSSWGSCDPNYKRGRRDKAPVSGFIQEIYVYNRVKSSGDARWKIMVYEWTGGEPDALLGVTAEVKTTKGSGGAHRKAVLSAPIPITKDHYYTLQYWTKDGNSQLGWEIHGGVGAHGPDDYDNGPEDPYGSHTNSDNNYHLYAPIILGSAPNPVTKVSPADETVIDPSAGNVFKGTYSNAMSTDIQSAIQYRYRAVGTPSWTDGPWATTPVCKFTIAGGTLETGSDYIVDCRCKDQLGGIIGPWMTSPWLVTATALPDIPVIDTPANGGTINDWYGYLDWTTSEQDAWRVQVFADDGFGAADPETSLYDSGAQEDADIRSLAIDYSDWNGQTVHPAVAVRYSAVWTDYAVVGVDVAFTGPDQPTCNIVVGDGDGIIEVSATHPGAQVFEATAADGMLNKESGDSWADCQSAVPSLTAGSPQLLVARAVIDAAYWVQYRAFVATDISGLVAEPPAASLLLNAEETELGVPAGAFIAYYQPWGSGEGGALDPTDWVAEGTLTAASALVTPTGTGPLEIPLINLGSLLTSNGRFVLIAEDETVEPTGVDAAVGISAFETETGIAPTLETGSGSPAVVAIDIYRDNVKGYDADELVRIAAGLAPEDTYEDREWPDGVDLTYKVKALAADGTSTYSELTT